MSKGIGDNYPALKSPVRFATCSQSHAADILRTFANWLSSLQVSLSLLIRPKSLDCASGAETKRFEGSQVYGFVAECNPAERVAIVSCDAKRKISAGKVNVDWIHKT